MRSPSPIPPPRTSTQLKTLVPLSVALLSAPVALAQNSVLTWHNDNARTGQNLNETLLTPANVKASSFGKLFNVALDGKVDAQPLYLSGLGLADGSTHNVVYAATEHDSIFALDADTGKQLWSRSLLGSGETTSDARNCGQVVPEIGITATPVIDPTAGAHGTLYIVAMSKDGAGNYYQRIHALDLTTGVEQAGSPVTVQASYPGTGANSSNGSVIFDPKQYKDRPGLLLLNGVVYTSWASHCDIEPYTSWIIGYDRLSLKQTSVLNLTPNGSEAAPWNAGAGPAADASGNLFISLGNGTFDTTLTTSGLPKMGDYGNSFVKVKYSGGQPSVADYWTMSNTISESGGDVDLGSGGFMLLPDVTDANGSTRHLGTGAGKDGNLYVVDRDNMGKFDSSSNATIYQELNGALPGGIWSSPAFFNGNVYYGPVGNPIRAFSVASGRLNGPTSTTSESFGYPGATPSISAFRTSDAILWALENTSGNAVLHAFDPNNLATEFWNSNQAANGRDAFGAGNKFIVPTIANGKVFVGTTHSLAVFGLLQSTTPPVADGDYTLTNSSSHLVLDDPGLSTSSGQQMVQWPSNGGANQKWFFAAQGSGFFTIQNVSSGLFLTDPNGATSPGTPLQQVTRTFNDTQLWSLVASGGGYLIQNKATGLALDDPAFSKSQGTGMILWPVNRGSNQVWTLR